MPLSYNSQNLPKQIFINGQYISSKNQRKLSVYNPKDEKLLADDVPVGDKQDVDAAVASAADAFKTWRKSPAKIRRDCLLKLANLIESNAMALAELTRISMGAPWAFFGAHEATIAVEALRYFAGWTDKFAGEAYPQEDGFMKVVRNEPLGVCAGIASWNAPLAIIGMKAGPALAVGNTFIFKTSEKTPFAGLALGSLINEAGFPPGVFQIVTGDGSTGALLARHMGIGVISFTGASETGRLIQEMASRSNLKRVTLELGSKSPAIVFDDAVLSNAVEWMAFTTNFFAEYKAALEARARDVGNSDAEEAEVWPAGGDRVGTKGFFIQPTVFQGVADDAEIYTHELTAPVAVLGRFTTEEEVLAKANNSHYGLMAGIFTQDIDRALRLASDLEAGMVGVNAISMQFVTAPFGGMKMSGTGRENAIDALRSYTERKTIFINMAKK